MPKSIKMSTRQMSCWQGRDTLRERERKRGNRAGIADTMHTAMERGSRVGWAHWLSPRTSYWRIRVLARFRHKVDGNFYCQFKNRLWQSHYVVEFQLLRQHNQHNFIYPAASLKLRMVLQIFQFEYANYSTNQLICKLFHKMILSSSELVLRDLFYYNKAW